MSDGRNIIQLPKGFLLGSETASTVSSRGVYKFPVEWSNRKTWADGQCNGYDTEWCSWSNLPEEDFIAMEDAPYTIGQFVWTGFDYLGEPTPYDGYWPSRSSYFGIVDLAGFPKDRYYLYKSRWMPDTPMVHILPHWNFPDKIGETIPVFVYSSGDVVELFLNGKSLGKKEKRPYEYRFRWDSVKYEPGELKAIAYKQNRKWAETYVRTTGKAVGLKAVPDKHRIKADGEDLVFVTVSLVDEEGCDVPTAENVISCSLIGDGEIVATDNGDPTCLITFSEPTRPAFNGLFLVIVKAKRGGYKPIRLTIESKGLEKAVVDIEM